VVVVKGAYKAYPDDVYRRGHHPELDAAYEQWCAAMPVELTPSLLWHHYQSRPRSAGLDARVVRLVANVVHRDHGIAADDQGWLLSPSSWRKGLCGQRTQWCEHAFAIACEVGLASLQVVQGELVEETAMHMHGIHGRALTEALRLLVQTPMVARQQLVSHPHLLPAIGPVVLVSGEHIDVVANLLAPACAAIASVEDLATRRSTSVDNVLRDMLAIEGLHAERSQHDQQQGLMVFDDGAWCDPAHMNADPQLSDWLSTWAKRGVRVVLSASDRLHSDVVAAATLTTRDRTSLISSLPWPTDPP
jgi:hypothetical protein